MRYGCPGCGDEERLRPKDGICRGCRELLDDARRIREEANERVQGVVVFHSRTAHWNPYIAHQTTELREAFTSLVFSASEPLPSSDRVREAGRWQSDERHRVIDRATRTAVSPASSHRGYDSAKDPTCLRPEVLHDIRRLHIAMARALGEAFIKGRESGSNALDQLAAGEITFDRFNELTTRGR